MAITQLLSTKLYMPRPRGPLVARPGLMARLNELLDPGRKLALVCAPAGFGKTTLLATWLSQLTGSRQPGTAAESAAPVPAVAWLSLDAGDNDPARFWSYVVAALDEICQGVVAATLPLLQAPQPVPMETILTALLNAIAHPAADICLILDDYHQIDVPAIHQSLSFLLDHAPSRLHLIVASRADPPLPLARLRVRNDLTELRAADLRFLPDETATFLRDVMDLALTSAEIGALDERTEGWIAGLQLAALALRNRADAASFIRAFGGSHRFVLDYLAEEVLEQLPPHLHTFVLHTSILDRLCGSLCDAVLEPEAGDVRPLEDTDTARHASSSSSSASQASSQQILDQLERMNLFLVPLDEERRWYRYHHLFSEVMRERLQAGAMPATIAALHRRASRWYHEQGWFDEAVHHGLAAHDWAWVAGILDHPALAVRVGSGQSATVLRWLHALPEHYVRTRPGLRLPLIFALMVAGDLRTAESELDQLQQDLQATGVGAETGLYQAAIAACRADISYHHGDLARTVALADDALALIPHALTDPTQQFRAALTRALATTHAVKRFQLDGDVTAARERLVADAIAPVRAVGNVQGALSSMTILAQLHVLQGRLHQAAQTYASAREIIPDPRAFRLLLGASATYFGMADLYREWNDLAAAEREIAQGMEVRAETTAISAGDMLAAYLVTARIQQACGHFDAALGTLNEWTEVARERRFFPPLTLRIAAARARLSLARADLAAAVHWASATDLHVDDVLTFSRESEYLTFARVLIAQGRSDPAAGFVQDALRLLARLRVAAEACERNASRIEILMLQALAYAAVADRDRALAMLRHALVHAEREGYVRIFLDEGAPMALLLNDFGAWIAESGFRDAQDVANVQAYARNLLAAFPQSRRQSGELEREATTHIHQPYGAQRAPAASDIQNRLASLTEREHEILRLIAAGYSNQEIADQLVVAVSTVKKHINNLYSKLEVQTRTQALVRAQALELL